jgi:hypothetical protein
MKKAISQALRSEIVDRWSKKVELQEEQLPKIPLDALLGEATDLAAVVTKYFEPQVIDGKEVGLESVATQSGVTKETADEIWELQTAVSEVKSRYVSLAKESDATVVRADELLSELPATLSFILEDGHHPEGETQLAQLRGEFSEVYSHDAMALALEGYSELASQHKTAFEEMGVVDAAIINEALQVADALRQRSADRLVGNSADDRKALMQLRNRLVGALQDKMANARRTIRFVFRGHPDIVDKAASRYFRQAKRRSRAKTVDVITGTEDTQEIAPSNSAE